MFILRGKTKSRVIPGPTLSFHESKWKSDDQPVTDPWITTSPKVLGTLGGTQVTESDGNRWPLPRKGKPLGDFGSEFFTQKKEVLTQAFPYTRVNVNRVSTAFGSYGIFEGNLVANCFDTTVNNPSGYSCAAKRPLKVSFPPDLSSSRAALNAKGAIAVSAVSPVNQIANAASSIGELLQDLPRIPGIALWEARLKALATLGASGDEFLNYIFGISPTISDMETFLKGVHNIDKRIDQFVRDSGRSVRRDFHFPTEKTVTTEVIPNVYSPAGWMVWNPSGPEPYSDWATHLGVYLPARETIRTRTTERDIWFSGAFTYHLPKGFDPLDVGDRRKLMLELFGAKPDLNTLWQLTPWSWAVDWFSNASQLVTNWQNYINYGSILRYGYLMETTVTTDTYSAGKVVSADRSVDPPSQKVRIGKPFPVVSSVTLRTTTKKRIQANPFGFGVSWDGLSTVQQAIVAALGITRVVR